MAVLRRRFQEISSQNDVWPRAPPDFVPKAVFLEVFWAQTSFRGEISWKCLLRIAIGGLQAVFRVGRVGWGSPPSIPLLEIIIFKMPAAGPGAHGARGRHFEIDDFLSCRYKGAYIYTYIFIYICIYMCIYMCIYI